MKTISIIWQGKGGEGIKTAADLLARGINETKYFAQSFPEYGPERAGSKISVYIRISDREIKSHYPIESADIVVSTIDVVDYNSKTIYLLSESEFKKNKNKIYIPALTMVQKYNSAYINMVMLGANLAILEKYFSLPLKTILLGITKKLEDKYSRDHSELDSDLIKVGINQTKAIL